MTRPRIVDPDRATDYHNHDYDDREGRRPHRMTVSDHRHGSTFVESKSHLTVSAKQTSATLKVPTEECEAQKETPKKTCSSQDFGKG